MKHYIEKFKNIRRKKKPRSQYFTKEDLELFHRTLPVDIEKASIAEIIHIIEQDLSKVPECEVCGNHVTFDISHNCYKTYCSKDCRYSEQGVISKMNKTVQDKYGVENISKLDRITEKRKQTNLDKYGVEVPAQSEAVMSKMKATMLDRYGVEHTAQSPELREKMKNTLEDKYGVKHALQNDNIKKTMRTTMKDRYGVDHALQNVDIKNKLKETFLLKFGEDHPSKNPDIKRKTIQSNRILYWDTFLEKLSQKNIDPLFTMESYVDDASEFKYKCMLCGNVFIGGISSQSIYCPYHAFRSKPEYEIKEWLLTLLPDLDIKANTKLSRMELNIYLEKYNLGIEYHGLYWHSDIHKKKNDHQIKWEFFNKKHIDVIQIFESEWFLKKDIVKSIIKGRLGLLPNKVHARKCILKEVPSSEYREFLETNHLQGVARARVKLGLYYNNELIQLMSFSKSRYNSNYEWENIRTCTKLDTHVVGGFSRLLKHFKDRYNPSTIISFVDVRYFTGKGYLNNGFKEKGVSKPNYFYFKKNSLILESRIKYQKHKLKNLLDVFDPNLSEPENMRSNGYLRIFDAGNKILCYNIIRE